MVFPFFQHHFLNFFCIKTANPDQQVSLPLFCRKNDMPIYYGCYYILE